MGLSCHMSLCTQRAYLQKQLGRSACRQAVDRLQAKPFLQW